MSVTAVQILVSPDTQWLFFKHWLLTVESNIPGTQRKLMDAGMTAGEANEAILKGMRIQCK